MDARIAGADARITRATLGTSGAQPVPNLEGQKRNLRKTREKTGETDEEGNSEGGSKERGNREENQSREEEGGVAAGGPNLLPESDDDDTSWQPTSEETNEDNENSEMAEDMSVESKWEKVADLHFPYDSNSQWLMAT
ncbi:uncharacterized protein MELLADRAFT_59705 [Melampsora larici-populina 98AG31]|uniref:Uncharacterized protein n=1 Tax=Melampsora larici-populina (strain 98AG31 / pathotype 3-4-7) TaxID=747676 RepID=F4R8J3_MELLP|nr:uncharacterized protein MELLADRAFT_59705 [Melampsora larici-populina 98AG31]EGG11490.1 hypothetical protein MELLADRAFT_59705 [Melampsora larici-populina 98AG31]